MVGQYDRVRRLVRAAGECEKFVIQVLAGRRYDPERFPGISNCFAQEIENAEAQLTRLRGFLGVEAHSDDVAPPLGAGPAQSGYGSAADILDPLAAIYACQRLQLVLYRTLLVAAEEIGDNELATICKEALWIKDASAARLGVELANLDLRRISQRRRISPAAANKPSRQDLKSEVEIHHTGPGHAEVSIQVDIGPGDAQSMHAVYAQAWSALADAMAKSRQLSAPPLSAKPLAGRTPPRPPLGSGAPRGL